MSTGQRHPLFRYLRKLIAHHDCQYRSDGELLDDFIARRQETAFAQLVGRHGPMVLRVCRRVLGHEQDAEDAFQATFLVLVRGSRSIRKREALADWLHGVAFRTAMKAKRSAARRRRHETYQRDASARERHMPLANASGLCPSSSLTWSEVQAVLDEELRKLSEPFRQAFVLCVLEGRSEAEAAALLGCKPGTASSRLARARQQLQRRLTRRGIHLSTLLAAMAVAEGGSQAVAGTLAQTTIQYGLLAAAGARAASQIPAHVSALAKGISAAMISGKVKIASFVVLAACLLAASAAVVAQQRTAITEPPAEERKPAMAQKLEPAAAKPQTTQGKDSMVYRGRVLGSDQKPLAGAEVYYVFVTHDDEPIPVRARTDAEGRFSFTLTKRDVPLSAHTFLGDPIKRGTVVVKAAGYALASRGLPRDPANLVFNLRRDNTPIEGRILDLQGKPLSGLNVTVLRLAAPQEGDLTRFLQRLGPGQAFLSAMGAELGNVFPELARTPVIPLFPSAKTDAQGRFRLTGFAREQLVEIRIAGPTIETQDLFVLTRTGRRKRSPC